MNDHKRLVYPESGVGSSNPLKAPVGDH